MLGESHGYRRGPTHLIYGKDALLWMVSDLAKIVEVGVFFLMNVPETNVPSHVASVLLGAI